MDSAMVSSAAHTKPPSTPVMCWRNTVSRPKRSTSATSSESMDTMAAVIATALAATSSGLWRR